MISNMLSLRRLPMAFGRPPASTASSYIRVNRPMSLEPVSWVK
jgi:hypothetical protein